MVVLMLLHHGVEEWGAYILAVGHLGVGEADDSVEGVVEDVLPHHQPKRLLPHLDHVVLAVVAYKIQMILL